MMDLTVVIPTYNGEKRLPDVLEKLRSQIRTEGISWEVLVVDNNSSDRTAAVVQQFQKNWPPQIPLRYVLETKQGAAFARQRSVKESQAELIGFLDDDNIPELDWVYQAVHFAQKHPQAGTYGSQIHGLFEQELPPNFTRIQSYFAIIEWGDQPKQYNPKYNLVPPSAGLVVRRKVWLKYVPETCILSGRTHSSMLTGEDLEALSYIHHQSNWEIWYNPAMQIDHKIPPKRLEPEYLIPFFRGIGLSRYVTRMVGVHPLLKPILTTAYLANDLRKLLLHILRYGVSAQDEIAACERALLMGSLNSFFYLWSNGYLKGKNTSEKPSNAKISQLPMSH
ncbi:hormogonium polysaccharide biosynthesis glycosyltransferase HpsE [Spirulina subsalsa FACHB-351]|uniref:Hormogonium polysaccharide biosynthesis glycosyltransferase HpsE n=1 Tax=Spirulina subsalsa FACHB-351 TaxID=234711 RepID=A0ABT3L7H6_9CYAN|nr:hormogonium polysaccharide biosynthesis glycosyltransferase HpsE [Spirulina subsalsa FACHB-351]